MGVELVLSLRLAPLYGSCILPPHRVPIENIANSPRRRPSVAAAEAHSNAEGNPDWRYHRSLGNHNHHHHHHLYHHQHFLHHFHPHPLHHHQHPLWQGFLDIEQQLGRVGSGFSIASQGETGEIEKQDHARHANSSLRDDHCSFPAKVDGMVINTVYAGATAAAAADLPLSLRMLKRKQQDLGKSSLMSGISEVGNSLLNAFSSVVSMMKTLQSHVIQIRQQFSQQEIEGLLNQVQREMHVSFLWLFQQIFACTPELMVLVMILLADFTAFSMVYNLEGLPASLYTPRVSITSSLSTNTMIDEDFKDFLSMSFGSSPSISDRADDIHNNGGSFGNGGRGVYLRAGDADGDPSPFKQPVNLNQAPYSVDDNLSAEITSTTYSLASPDVSTSQIGLPPHDYTDDTSASHFSAMAAAMAFQELGVADDVCKNEPLLPEVSDDGEGDVQVAGTEEITWSSSNLVLDQMTAQSLVAPFTTRIEDDNYACYDRTDLAYQDAISNDSNNSLLLANYAQFLFLVRKDHDRAEELFRKAVFCDPFDCDAISRFASFLWLARRNLVAAEKAFQAAMQADPNNSFHAANYAHFLWNSGL